MASRYDSSSDGSSNNEDFTQTSYEGPQTVTSTQNQTQTGTSTTNSRATKDVNSQTMNMTPEQLAALDLLIKQLLGGGTKQMAQDRARRQQEIEANQNLRGDYTKEAAFADAQGAMAQILQQAMEKAMPSLVRAAEGSGTSQNSMRALMTQDALNRASQSASALGLGAAADYGKVASGFSSVLEALTRPDNAAVDALVQALAVAKGSVQNTVSHELNQGSSTTNSTTNTQTSGSQTSGPQTITRVMDYAGDGNYNTNAGATNLVPIDYGTSNLSNTQTDSYDPYTRNTALDYVPASDNLYDFVMGNNDPYASYYF